MRQHKSNSVWTFIQRIANFYSEVKLANRSAGEYKIIKINAGELAQEPEVIVQVRNKNISYTMKVIDIVRDSELLHLFSKEDVRTITYLACEYKNRPKVKLDSVSFCTKLNRLVFSLFYGDRTNKIVKSATEVANNHHLIDAMSPQDAKKVGYTAGSETTHAHHEQIKELKPKN